VATVVAFHAHPDDEVLLTGGTIARLAAEGHRVVIVVASDGVVGAVAATPSRLDELRASAAVLGAAEVVHLGYADSGHGPVLYPDPPGRVRFARADVAEAAGRLAGLLRAERAGLLLSYDSRGGYGHRDHVMVHRVGALAAELAGIGSVLEATLPRELISRAYDVLRFAGLARRYDGGEIRGGFAPRAAITYRADVRRFARQKRDALAAHQSQVSGNGRSAWLFRLLIRLPPPVFALVAGHEWFADPSQPRRDSATTIDWLPDWLRRLLFHDLGALLAVLTNRAPGSWKRAARARAGAAVSRSWPRLASGRRAPPRARPRRPASPAGTWPCGRRWPGPTSAR